METELINDIIEELMQNQPDYAPFFDRLKNTYTKNEFVEILNNILDKSQDTVITKTVLNEIYKERNILSIQPLMDFILSKSEGSFKRGQDICDFVSLKVLAIKTLATYRSTAAVPTLLYSLNGKGENYKVRLAAAEALGNIGDNNAVDSLINIVKDEEEKSVYVRESAAAALGMIGDMRAVEPFLSILENKKTFADKFTFLKEKVLEALGKLSLSSDKRIISAFEEALYDPSAQIRLNALEGISNSNCTAMFDEVKRLLDDEDEEVAKGAVVALYNLSDRRILDEIINNPKMREICKKQAKEIIEEYEEE